MQIAAPIMRPKVTVCAITAKTTHTVITAISVNRLSIGTQPFLKITPALAWVSFES